MKTSARPPEGGVIGDNSRESHLLFVFVEAEGERVVDGLPNQLERTIERPIGLRAEEFVHEMEVEACAIGGDEVAAAAPFV